MQAKEIIRRIDQLNILTGNAVRSDTNRIPGFCLHILSKVATTIAHSLYDLVEL